MRLYGSLLHRHLVTAGPAGLSLGPAGRAFPSAIEAKRWARRRKGSRAFAFTSGGARQLALALPRARGPLARE